MHVSLMKISIMDYMEFPKRFPRPELTPSENQGIYVRNLLQYSKWKIAYKKWLEDGKTNNPLSEGLRFDTKESPPQNLFHKF